MFCSEDSNGVYLWSAPSAQLERGQVQGSAAARRRWRAGERPALGSSLSSEPRRLAGLSVPRHAGVLARSKISGSLLHRLSRPWHGLGPRGSHRDQRYGASPQIFFACGGRLLIRIDPPHASAIAASASSPSDSRCCFLSAISSQTFLTNSLKLKQTHVREACVCAGPL